MSVAAIADTASPGALVATPMAAGLGSLVWRGLKRRYTQTRLFGDRG
jgi:hypothetical protein